MLFRGGAAQRRRGEATVWYLYSETAPHEILEFSPDARFIVMLRNPVDMMYSLHSHMLFTGDEDIEDFEEALAAEPDRRAGRRIPARASRPEGLLYRSCASYSRHVRRWLDAVGPDTMKVIIFDDFAAEPAAVYRDTLEFLSVDPEFRPDFDVVNRNKAVRSERLLDITSSPRFYRATSFLPGPVYHAFRRGLKRLNTRYQKRPSLDGDVRARLTREFVAEVEDLGRVIGRDLSAWTRVGAGSRS